MAGDAAAKLLVVTVRPRLTPAPLGTVTSRDVEELKAHDAILPPMVEEQGETKLEPDTVTLTPESEFTGLMLLTTLA